MGTLLTIADITITTLIFYMRSAETIHLLFDWTCTVWTKALAHCLYKSCSAMETHAMKLPANRYCADINVRGGLSVSGEDWQLLWTMHLSVQQPRSVTSCVRVAVFPSTSTLQ